MDHSLHRATTRLEFNATLRVEDGVGKGLAVFDGMVWITQEGDPVDHVVGAGGHFRFDRPGLAVVQALQPTDLMLLDELVVTRLLRGPAGPAEVRR